MVAKHGRLRYVVDGEPIVNKRVDTSDQPPAADESEEAPFRFTRMLNEQYQQPPDDLLEALGEKMAADAGEPQLDSSIPAGYTYLGQFIAHEITHNGSKYKKNLKEIQQLTSPSVNLGSLYGDMLLQPEADEVELLPIDQTKFDSDHTELPRFRSDLPRVKGKPAIPDERNDNNLNLAQIHVALIRFHNAVALRLAKGGSVSNEGIRATVIQHFQSVVLHDYLRMVIDDCVYGDVLEYGPACYRPTRGSDNLYPAMPIEFAMAAFRFGHSMVRSDYILPQWNQYHYPSLGMLLLQTNNLGGIDQLQSSWVANWCRLFDFRGLSGSCAEKPLAARRIDTRIAGPLKNLPEAALPAPAPSANLPVRTLLFCAAARLPSGEDAAGQMNAFLKRAGRDIQPIHILSENEIAAEEGEDVRRILADPGMRGNTPLWFYILKEAQLRGQGEKLGPLGSRIVMEVLYDLIANSEYSILREKDWQPTLPSTGLKKGYAMTDLLLFAGDIDPYNSIV